MTFRSSSSNSLLFISSAGYMVDRTGIFNTQWMIFISIVASPRNLRQYESIVIQFFYGNTKEKTREDRR